MKKLLLIIPLLAFIFTYSQSTTTNITFKKLSRQALLLELPNTEAESQGTIIAKLKESGYNPETTGSLFWKKNTQDGFYIFKDIRLPSLGSEKLDLYFKVEKKKRSSSASNVYLLLSTGNENFVTPETDAGLWDNAQIFLNGFVDNAVAYKIVQEIKTQENKIKSLQSKYLLLQKDQKDLEDRIVRYQKELEANKAKQIENQAEIENQVKILEAARQKQKDEN